MLIGTSCRFSARLRAVTMPSASLSEEASAACTGKAWKVAAPDRAAAMAMASLEGENVDGGSRRDETAAECAGDLRFIFIPLYFDYRMRSRACQRRRSCLARAFSVNRVNRTFNNKFDGVREGSEVGRESLQTIAECAAQGFELTFEVPPIADSRRVERLAHLLGTCGAYRPSSLVEGEAGGARVQSAMGEQAPDLRLWIEHQVLVAHMQQPARQDLVPMVHEPQIAAVIAAEVPEVVAEGLAFGKILLERLEAGAHRVAAHIDEGGPRQHGVNQAQMAEIIGHLVDEARPPRADGRGFLDVAAAEEFELPRRGPDYTLGVCIVRGVGMVELADDGQHIG